jgi:hypothetical protein
MISSKKNIIWIIVSIVFIYITLVSGGGYSLYFWILMLLFYIVFYFIDKRCENITLDTISQLYSKNKQIDIKELCDNRSCKFTQNDLKFLNYYKRKGLIPFDAELIDPENYSSHTFE